MGVDAADIEVEKADLRYAEIRVADRLSLVEVIARKIGAQFVQQGSADGSGPTECRLVIVRYERHVLNRPLAAVEVIEPHDISAGEKLIVSSRIVHASVILIPAACIWLREIKNPPVGDPIWTTSGCRRPSRIPLAQPISWNQRTAVVLRYDGRNARLTPRSTENLRCQTPGILCDDVLLKFRCFQRNGTNGDCVVEPGPFVGEEK